MKAINSKERSKQVWQFIFIFLGLAVVPVSLIFFSYYRIPEKLHDQEQRKLINYTNFERSQKVLVRQLDNIDSNLNLLVNESSNELPEVINTRIASSIENIKQTDTGRLVTLILNGYNNHLKHVNNLVRMRKEMKDIKEIEQKLKDCTEACDQLRLRASNPMP